MGNDTERQIFISYGRKDAGELVEAITRDLKGYRFWMDTRELRGGSQWEREIKDALRESGLCLALLSPHSVRSSRHRPQEGQDPGDSVCLDEIAFARHLNRPIVPAMVAPCEPPLSIFRLQFVDFTDWRESPEDYEKAVSDLQEGIKAALEGEFRYRTWVDRLRPWDFGAFLQHKREGFTGRDWLFEDMAAWLDEGSAKSLLILGDPGIGKSAIAAELIHKNPEGRVLAYHCCQSDTPETLEPGRFVRSIASMMASRIPEYSARLDDTDIIELLSERASDRDPGSAFERGILSVLRDLPAPADGPRMLVVDALDEATLHRGGTSIVDLLSTRIHRFPDWLRFLGTTRRDPNVLNSLSGLDYHQLDAQDSRNMEDLEAFVARRLSREPLATRLEASGETAESVRKALTDNSSGNFLYVTFALDAVESGRAGFEDLAQLPPGLLGQYQWFFQRQFGDGADRPAVEAVLAVLVAGQEALPARDLGLAAGLDPDLALPRVLRSLAPYLREEHPHGEQAPRYQLFHKSLVDWLTAPDRAGAPFWIPSRAGHRKLVDALYSRYQKNPNKLSPYGLHHLGSHLAALASTSTDDEERSEAVEGLVAFSGDAAVQGRRRDEPLGVLKNLDTALEVASTDDSDISNSVSRTLRASMNLVRFRRTRLRPRRLFQLAEEGKLEQVQQEISLFRADGPWRGAALLTAAWLAKEDHPQAARRLFDQVRTEEGTFEALEKRMDVVFHGGDLGTSWLVPPPNPWEVEAMMVQVRGTDLEAFSGMAEGFADPGEAPMLDAEGNMEASTDEASVELARIHGPPLVSFAHASPNPGDTLLQEYIALHAANSYRTYRNRALGWLLQAVVAHPDDKWCASMLGLIAEGALSEEGVEFGECVPISRTAVQASLGAPMDMEAFRSASEAALKDGVALHNTRGESDSWGSYRRRYGVYAEGFGRAIGDRKFAIEILTRGLDLPHGYAGFTAPAALTLAESARVVLGEARGEEVVPLETIIGRALEAAQEAAHNVQDPTFCARSTSRVNAMRRNWWHIPPSGMDLNIRETLEHFLHDPGDPEFSALHLVGWEYQNRNEMRGSLRLPARMRDAASLRELATIYQRPLLDLHIINPEVEDSDQPLAPGTEVRVPDPGFVALLAGRLAAELLSAPELAPMERIRGIQALAPLASRNETALDTVMGRLLLAAKTKTPAFRWEDSGTEPEDMGNFTRVFGWTGSDSI